MGGKGGFGGRGRRRQVTSRARPRFRWRRAAASAALAAGLVAGETERPASPASPSAAATNVPPVSEAEASEDAFLARAKRNRLDALHRSGVALMTLGRLPEAEARLVECVRADPGNPFYLRSLVQVHAMREKAQTQVLAWPRLARVQFREATVSEALQNLQERSRRMDATRRGFNLVYRVGPEARQARVTLDVQDLPLDVVVRYVCELAGLPCEIEGRTVVVGRPVVARPR